MPVHTIAIEKSSNNMSRRRSSLLAAYVFAASLSALPAAAQQPTKWDQLPRMQLERQFAGPLQDTLIQRWRDPVDGTVCYLYLPISAAHSPPTASGFVEYGANTVGSISCMAGAAARPAR